MSKETTENIGVNNLKNLFLSTERIHTAGISASDKGVSWDGYIDVFKDKRCHKKDFIGKVPIQIKTIKSNGKTNKFPIAKDDMENYKKEKRIIYFCIRENGDSCFSYYYLPLQLWDIRDCLKKYGDKKTKSFEFLVFPTNKEQVYSTIKYFIEDYDKRSAIMPNISSIDELIKQKGNNVDLSMVIRLPKKPSYIDFLKAIKEQRPYLVYKCKDSGIDTVVDRMGKNKEKYTIEKKTTITIDDNIYFRNATIVYSEEGVSINADNNFEIILKNSLLHFDAKSFDDLQDRLKITKFFIALIERKQFEIDGYIINVDDPEIDKMKDEISQEYDIYYKLDTVINTLKISKKPSFTKTKTSEVECLDIVYQSMVESTPVQLEDFTDKYGTFKLFGLSLFFFIESRKDGYVLRDWHTGFIEIKNENGTTKSISSAYFLSDQENNILNDIDNVDYEKLEEIFLHSESRDAQLLSHVVINLINHYDVAQDKRPLLLAKKICEKEIREDIDNVSALVNLAQICFRLNVVVPQSVLSALNRLLTISKDNHLRSFCINVAISDFNGATREFDQLNDEDKKTLKKWPIYSFYLKAGKHCSKK